MKEGKKEMKEMATDKDKEGKKDRQRENRNKLRNIWLKFDQKFFGVSTACQNQPID